MAVRPIDGTWSKFVWNLSKSESLARKFRDGKACLIDLRLAVEAQPTLTPPNEPMTIEQLRGMDGEPVWIVDIGGRNWYGPGWAIVDRENNLVRTVKNWNPVFFEKYGEQWLAYRRPKEEQ